MKIFGIGTDIVSIVRIKKSIKNKRFVSRVYNVKEISKCKKLIKSEHCFAKRFAAKEAFSKALGTGISNGINLNEIIVKNNISINCFVYGFQFVKFVIIVKCHIFAVIYDTCESF